MDSYFANASGKDFVELDNDYAFSIDGKNVHQRLLTSHDTAGGANPTSTTDPKDANPNPTPTTPPKKSSTTKPTVSPDGTVS